MFALMHAMASKLREQDQQQSNDESAATTASSSSAAPSLLLSSLPSNLIDEWLAHCVTCFRDNDPAPLPTDHFEDHLRCDPTLDLSGVSIVLAPENTQPAASASSSSAAVHPVSPDSDAPRAQHRVIASTARVLLRQQYIGGDAVAIGGIAEVSTREGHRGRGYAELCVERSIRYCRLLRLQSVQLHAASNVIPYYAKQGCHALDRGMATKTDFEADGARLLSSRTYSIRNMQHSEFFSEDLLPQFQNIHAQYSSQFNGPFVRDEAYWQSWVRTDVETSIASTYRNAIEVFAAYEEWNGSDPAPSPPSPIRCLAYLLLQRSYSQDQDQQRDRKYLVREYGALAGTNAIKGRQSDEESGDDGGRSLFVSLVAYGLSHARTKFAEQDANAAKHSVFTTTFALPITQHFNPPLQQVHEFHDEGWMAQPLTLNMDSDAGLAVAEEEAAQTRQRQHRGQPLEEAPLVSQFTSSLRLHDESEKSSDHSAMDYLAMLRTDVKNKFVVWQTDSY